MPDFCTLPDLKLPLPLLHWRWSRAAWNSVAISVSHRTCRTQASRRRLARRHRFSCLVWDEYQIVTVCYSQMWSKGCQFADGPCKDWSSQTDLWSCSPVSEIQCRIETLDEASRWFCFMISSGCFRSLQFYFNFLMLNVETIVRTRSKTVILYLGRTSTIQRLRWFQWLMAWIA